MAREALQQHVDLMAESGDKIPDPTDYENLEPDADAVGPIWLEAVLPGRSKRINITLDENLIADIDANSTNRSAFLADAAREKLWRTFSTGHESFEAFAGAAETEDDLARKFLEAAESGLGAETVGYTIKSASTETPWPPGKRRIRVPGQKRS